MTHALFPTVVALPVYITPLRAEGNSLLSRSQKQLGFRIKEIIRRQCLKMKLYTAYYSSVARLTTTLLRPGRLLCLASISQSRNFVSRRTASPEIRNAIGRV